MTQIELEDLISYAQWIHDKLDTMRTIGILPANTTFNDLSDILTNVVSLANTELVKKQNG